MTIKHKYSLSLWHSEVPYTSQTWNTSVSFKSIFSSPPSQLSDHLDSKDGLTEYFNVQPAQHSQANSSAEITYNVRHLTRLFFYTCFFQYKQWSYNLIQEKAKLCSIIVHNDMDIAKNKQL